MDKDIYRNTQQQLFLVAQLVKDMPLEAFIECAQFSNEVAPFLDPTLFIKAGNKLDKIIELAAALKRFQETALKLYPELKETR